MAPACLCAILRLGRSANGYVANPSIIANVGFCKRGALLRHGVLIVVVDVRRASSRIGTRPDGSLQGNVAG